MYKYINTKNGVVIEVKSEITSNHWELVKDKPKTPKKKKADNDAK